MTVANGAGASAAHGAHVANARAWKLMTTARGMEMAKPGPWIKHAICPGCGWHTEANSLGAVPFLACCPECGERYSWTSFGRACWDLITVRWIEPERQIFKPSTWDLQGHYEFMESSHG